MLHITVDIFLFSAPLGVLDPLEQQNFYKNMNTGPQGSIYSRPPPQTPSRESKCHLLKFNRQLFVFLILKVIFLKKFSSSIKGRNLHLSIFY